MTFKKPNGAGGKRSPLPTRRPESSRAPRSPPITRAQDDDADERMTRHDGMHRQQHRGYESTAHAMAGITADGYDDDRSTGPRGTSSIPDDATTAYRNPLRKAGAEHVVSATPHPASSVSSTMAYDPARYANLGVSPDVKELFGYVSRYVPVDVAPPTPLKPFVPDYVPAVGDVDEFVKVPRPDGLDDGLGVRVLDEPGPEQSDPASLSLKLRRADGGGLGGIGGANGGAGGKGAVVGRIERPESKEGAAKLDAWIESVNALHEGDDKSGAQFAYSKNMPDIETVMREFDPEVDEALRNSGFPDNLPDMDLKSTIKYMCAILDIPVYEGHMNESLHMMFTAYLHLKNNPYLSAKATTPGKGKS